MRCIATDNHPRMGGAARLDAGKGSAEPGHLPGLNGARAAARISGGAPTMQRHPWRLQEARPGRAWGCAGRSPMWRPAVTSGETAALATTAVRRPRQRPAPPPGGVRAARARASPAAAAQRRRRQRPPRTRLPVGHRRASGGRRGGAGKGARRAPEAGAKHGIGAAGRGGLSNAAAARRREPGARGPAGARGQRRQHALRCGGESCSEHCIGPAWQVAASRGAAWCGMAWRGPGRGAPRAAPRAPPPARRAQCLRP
jgi:hypothetical protein